MVRQNFLSTLAGFGTLFALMVIGLGAFTRLMDAGLGCPDWPGCYGHFIVTSDNVDPAFVAYKAWAEMIHRYFVGGLSTIILVILGIIFLRKPYRTRGNCIFAVMLILLLSYQIMLGQWTVTLKLIPIIVAQHLLGGFSILATLWMIHLVNKNAYISNMQVPTIIKIGAVFACLLLLLQICLGAWTSTNYASLSCSDFPFCNNNQPYFPTEWQQAFNLSLPVGVNYDGGVLPELARQTIQMTHRMGALIVAMYLFMFAGAGIAVLKNQPKLVRILYLILTLLLVQICLGISNVLFGLPIITAISHTLGASLLLLTILTFTIYSFAKPSSSN